MCSIMSIDITILLIFDHLHEYVNTCFLFVSNDDLVGVLFSSVINTIKLIIC